MDDLFTLDDAVFFDATAFAVAATHTTAGGTATSCTVVVDETVQTLTLAEDEGGLSNERIATIAIRTAQVAAPARGETITIASGQHAGTWRIDDFAGRDPGVILATCRLATVAQVAGAHQRVR